MTKPSLTISHIESTYTEKTREYDLVKILGTILAISSTAYFVMSTLN